MKVLKKDFGVKLIKLKIQIVVGNGLLHIEENMIDAYKKGRLFKSDIEKYRFKKGNIPWNKKLKTN